MYDGEGKQVVNSPGRLSGLISLRTRLREIKISQWCYLYVFSDLSSSNLISLASRTAMLSLAPEKTGSCCQTLRLDQWGGKQLLARLWSTPSRISWSGKQLPRKTEAAYNRKMTMIGVTREGWHEGDFDQLKKLASAQARDNGEWGHQTPLPEIFCFYHQRQCCFSVEQA